MEYLIKPPSLNENESNDDIKPCQNEPCQLEKLELASRLDRIEKHIAQLELHRLYQIDENRKISRKLDDILYKFAGDTSGAAGNNAGGNGSASTGDASLMNESTLVDDH